jgi:hypothetical protein
MAGVFVQEILRQRAISHQQGMPIHLRTATPTQTILRQQTKMHFAHSISTFAPTFRLLESIKSD